MTNQVPCFSVNKLRVFKWFTVLLSFVLNINTGIGSEWVNYVDSLNDKIYMKRAIQNKIVNCNKDHWLIDLTDEHSEVNGISWIEL